MPTPLFRASDQVQDRASWLDLGPINLHTCRTNYPAGCRNDGELHIMNKYERARTCRPGTYTSTYVSRRVSGEGLTSSITRQPYESSSFCSALCTKLTFGLVADVVISTINGIIIPKPGEQGLHTHAANSEVVWGCSDPSLNGSACS